MPSSDDTLNPGGPQVDPFDELCLCGHTLGQHHTLDENCTIDGCKCEQFDRVNREIGEGQPTDEQVQARMNAIFAARDKCIDAVGEEAFKHAQTVAAGTRQLAAELQSEGRIGEIKDELDHILDAAQLCTDPDCGHRRDLHPPKSDGCWVEGCGCPGFLEPEQETTDEEMFADARRETSVEQLTEFVNRGRAAQEAADEVIAEVKAGVDIVTEPKSTDFVHDWPIDHEAIRRASRQPELPQAGNLAEDPMDTHMARRTLQSTLDHAEALRATDRLPDPDKGHGAGDGFGGTDEGSHLHIEPKSTQSDAREDDDDLLEVPAFLRQKDIREPIPKTHDDRADELDAGLMGSGEGMSNDKRKERNAVQSETLDSTCTCGHRYGDHWTDNDRCSCPGCECEGFNPVVKPVELFRTTRCAGCGHRKHAHSQGDRDCMAEGCECRAFIEYTSGFDVSQFTRCAECGHEKVDHHLDEPHTCLDADCKCEAFIQCTPTGRTPTTGPQPYAGSTFGDGAGLPFDALSAGLDELERRVLGMYPEIQFAHDELIGPAPEDIVVDGKKPYSTPLLRKKYVENAELRQLLKDAGRLDLLGKPPEFEVDRVTTSLGAEYWQEIESLADTPQGSSETTAIRSRKRSIERRITAIAHCLLGLRRSLGAVSQQQRDLFRSMKKTAEVQDKTVETLDLLVKRLGLKTDDSEGA